jgi:hypothetical protein
MEHIVSASDATAPPLAAVAAEIPFTYEAPSVAR